MSRPLRALAIAASLACVHVSAAAAQSRAMSVESFLERRANWDLFADSGQRLRLEGRVDSAGPTLLKMQRADLPFRKAEGGFPSLGRRRARVEVTGRLVRDGDAYRFVVEELRQLRGDAEDFRLRRARLDRDDVDGLRELGAEARRRAAFYDDDDLDRFGRALLGDALRASRSTLAPDDDGGRLRLAEKLAAFDVPLEQVVELRHEALRISWRKLRDDASGGTGPFDRLRLRIAELLPGATTPGPKVLPRGEVSASLLIAGPGGDAAEDRKLRARYDDATAVRAFRGADAATRNRFARLFYERVALAGLGLRDVTADAIASGRWDPTESAGPLDAVAERLARLVPERADLLDAVRERLLDERLAAVASATREELDTLVARLAEAGRDAEVARAKRKWLAGRVRQLRFDGADGLVEAAAETLDVAGDEAAAVALLREAATLAPDSPRIAALFERLGYVRDGDGWSERTDAPTARVDAAVREGRVVPGMTAAQVRRTLGEPDAVSRSIALSEVDESWIYGRGGTRLVIHLRRFVGTPAGEAKVVAQGSDRR